MYVLSRVRHHDMWLIWLKVCTKKNHYFILHPLHAYLVLWCSLFLVFSILFHKSVISEIRYILDWGRDREIPTSAKPRLRWKKTLTTRSEFPHPNLKLELDSPNLTYRRALNVYFILIFYLQIVFYFDNCFSKCWINISVFMLFSNYLKHFSIQHCKCQHDW